MISYFPLLSSHITIWGNGLGLYRETKDLSNSPPTPISRHLNLVQKEVNIEIVNAMPYFRATGHVSFLRGVYFESCSSIFFTAPKSVNPLHIWGWGKCFLGFDGFYLRITYLTIESISSHRPLFNLVSDVNNSELIKKVFKK